MYDTILITLDTTYADRTILEHIRPLATLCRSHLILLHVADGWAARQFGPNTDTEEVRQDRAYLAEKQAELQRDGFTVDTELAFGNPKEEIVKWIKNKHCDLIAMTTHGHRLLADLLLGETARHVQHHVTVPILLVKAKK